MVTVKRQPRAWIEPDPGEPEIPEWLPELVNGSPLAAQLLLKRSIKTVEEARAFLSWQFYKPSDPMDLPGMDTAASLVLNAVDTGKKICVWGDFDMDGQTSTTILVSCLKELGADVTHHIPLRAPLEDENPVDTRPVYGHGVHSAKLAELKQAGVEFLLTCDTGITAVDAVEWAVENGMEVVITDHHELPETLPAAGAIVNPRLLPEDHPLYPLPGCGAAWMLASELLRRRGKTSFADTLLDLAALGIVADVAELRGESRYLLQRGLAQLQDTRRTGLLQLMEKAGVDRDSLDEEVIGFMIAPRLNALGRLGDANPVVDFFMTASNSGAAFFVETLEGLNQRRKLSSSTIYRSAVAILEKQPELENKPVIVLSQAGWQGGVVGIVASRLVERYGKPVILLNEGADGIARGSARSVPGINITAAIARHAELLKGFGGHPMAAGMSLPSENIGDFRQALCFTVDRMQVNGHARERLIDFDLPLSDATLSLARELGQLAPFGNGNPVPVFISRRHTLQEVSLLGPDGISVPVIPDRDGFFRLPRDTQGNITLPLKRNPEDTRSSYEHMILTVLDEEGVEYTIRRWNGADLPLPEGTFDLAYTLRSSTYKGKPQMLLEWVDSRPVSGTPSIAAGVQQLVVEDWRSQPRDSALLVAMSLPDAVLWDESAKPVRDRWHLTAAKTLVFGSVPPGSEEIRTAIDRVKPERVILLGGDLPEEDWQAFMRALMMELRPLLMPESAPVTIQELAGHLGQREPAIDLGLKYLAADGRLQVKPTGQHLCFSIPEEPAVDIRQKSILEVNLRMLLKETAAFRRSFITADAESLRSSFFDH